jgi:hypothetical protein
MNYLKPVIAGILFGAAVFFLPFFILRVVAFAFIISLLFRLFARRRFHGGWGHSRFYADSLRNEDEWYNRSFRQDFIKEQSWKQDDKSSATEIKIA